jgi:hypothetical protein
LKITLNNVVIVDRRQAASGAWPSLETTEQITHPLRAGWKRVFDRGGGLYILPVTVWDLPFPSLGKSFVGMFRRLQTLPRSGPLEIEEGGEIVYSHRATIRSPRAINRTGASASYQLELLIEGPVEFRNSTDRAVTLDGEDGYTLEEETILILLGAVLAKR